MVGGWRIRKNSIIGSNRNPFAFLRRAIVILLLRNWFPSPTPSSLPLLPHNPLLP